MDAEEVKLKVGGAIKALEDCGDVVITTSVPGSVVDRIVEALGGTAQTFLNDDEFRAVLNSLNVLVHDVKLDGRDFQTIIGIDRDGLRVVLDKLQEQVRHGRP